MFQRSKSTSGISIIKGIGSRLIILNVQVQAKIIYNASILLLRPSTNTSNLFNVMLSVRWAVRILYRYYRVLGNINHLTLTLNIGSIVSEIDVPIYSPHFWWMFGDTMPPTVLYKVSCKFWGLNSVDLHFPMLSPHNTGEISSMTFDLCLAGLSLQCSGHDQPCCQNNMEYSNRYI